MDDELTQLVAQSFCRFVYRIKGNGPFTYDYNLVAPTLPNDSYGIRQFWYHTAKRLLEQLKEDGLLVTKEGLKDSY
jgi:hypothetical protein